MIMRPPQRNDVIEVKIAGLAENDTQVIAIPKASYYTAL
jgi:hypothetical protein